MRLPTCAGRFDRVNGSFLDRQRLDGQLDGSVTHCPRSSGLLDVRHDLPRNAELRFLQPIGQPVGDFRRARAGDAQPNAMALPN